VSTTFHEEEILGKAYDSRLMKRLLAYLAPYRLHVVMAVVLLLGVSFLQLVGPYLTKVAIDRYIRVGDLRGLSVIALIFLGVIVLEFFMDYAHTYIAQWVGQKVMYDLRVQIFGHVQNLSVAFFDRNPVGRLITRITTDVETLNEMFTSGVVAIFGDVFTLLGIVIVLLKMNWKLALVTFSVMPLLFYATFLFRIKVRQTYRDIRVRIARLNAFLQENIVGMAVVQLFNREKRNFENFDRLNKDHLEAYIKTIFYYAVFYPAVEIISAVALALIIWYGGSRVLAGTLTFGALVAFIQYARRFFQPISDLSEKYNIMQSAMASSERVFKLLDEKPAVLSSPNPRRLTTLRGEIEFRNVWFAYNGEDYVLKDISFVAEPGEKVALVGATGAGKTSIVSLLMRFYEPQRGAIHLDDIDIREVDVGDLRRQMALVLQDVFIFDGTVTDNIRLGNTDIPVERVIQAAKDANAHDFIMKLPKGYDTEVKERGSLLSVGQKQLLSFARALAFDPRILILDEATSSVDTETELLIQAALERLMKGRTSIIIAHRLSTIQNADKIIVLHKGQIREVGTHQELLSKGGIYYRLYQLQYADQERRARVAASG